MIITSDNVTEYTVHRFSAEASELGFPPGRWPVQIETTLGNKRPFYFEKFDGEAAQYKQELGCIVLRVYND